ncbi:hypothetical protein M8C21_029410 [Ambrosia artemisiifolia]|uniref:Uncharacterized protein n=1 Tax=Ambrosia artemisiifolia TaxID=4212 RepID=A0AAD5G8V3_AMBAR|nr:hypothetical protein M8C21_029410 [Ambrosia artemisiifolia]
MIVHWDHHLVVLAKETGHQRALKRLKKEIKNQKQNPLISI